jgi:uncharacterized membrane protein YphA (DoxX/SURF4 family)
MNPKNNPAQHQFPEENTIEISTSWLDRLAYHIAFFLNGLFIFLLIFESRFVAPQWMKAVGRIHPLILHFPLVVLMLYGVWVLISGKKESGRWSQRLAEILLLIGVFTASVAAFSGFILSKEEGYELETLVWHKWTGVAVSLFSIVWYSYRHYFLPWKITSKIVAVSFIAVLTIAGHLGGNLTHGSDFLISPLPAPEKKKVAIEDALVYDDLVQPVLQQKCYACHNGEKSKGDLQMHTRELLAKGGKSGMLWDTTKADLGLLLQRIHLPAEDKKHMPPRGKVQLTDDEVMLLAAWIKSGSRFDQKVSTLSPQDPVYSYAINILGGGRIEEYDFVAADPAAIQKLNTNYRLIRPLSAESPALSVNFYNRASFKSEDVAGLSALANQIVSMDLSKMPVKDEDLKSLAQFPELRKLILNFTDIEGKTLGELRKLTRLRELSLSGTQVTIAEVKVLAGMPSLQKVYVWSTSVKPEDISAFKSQTKIQFETGYQSDTVILALNPPIIENENQILSGNATIKLKHQIPGTTIRYTIDGSEPDSLTSLVYKEPIRIAKNTKVKARAFKSGWYGSKGAEKFFFLSAFPIDSVRLITPPDPKYPAQKDATLADGIKSDNSQSSGKWLGYRDTDFQTYLFFRKSVHAQSVTISMLQSINGYIFPPVKVEVWGGANENNLKLLKTITPDRPVKETQNVDNLAIEADFQPQYISCIKIKAVPLNKLPAWHPGKGEKAWIFVDEVFVN